MVLLIAAAGIQGNLPSRLSLLGGRPDLLLVVLIAFALAKEPAFGAGLGFIAGLIHGSVVGTSLAGFIATRTLTGILAGFMNTRLFRDNPVVPTASALWLTAACEGLFLLGNPRVPFVTACRTLLGECILNAMLTLALCVVLRHLETRRKIRLADARV